MAQFRRKKKSGNKSSPREGEPFISPENLAADDESGACSGVSDVAASTTSESYNPKDSKKSKVKKEKAKKKGGKTLTEEEPVHSEQKQESFGMPLADQVAVEPQRPQILPQHEDKKHSSSQSKKEIHVSEDKPELVRRTEELEQYKQDLMTKNSLLEKEKKELESKVKEAEESKKELDDMNQKYYDLQRECQNTAKELQTRKDELEMSKRKVEEFQQKNTSSKNELQRNYDIQIHDLKQQNEDLKGQFVEKKRKLNEMEKILAEKESVLEKLKHQLEVHKEESRQACHRATELQQKVDSLHEAVKDGEKMKYAKEKELFELQKKLVEVFEDVATKDKIALAKQCEMQKEILELKKYLQQKMELNKTNQELNQKCLILETEITHQEAKLKDFQAELQEKEEFMANLHESLEKTKEGHAQMSQKLKQKEMEFQDNQTVNDELKTEIERFKVFAQKTEEQKESLSTHFKDELKDKMETIAYLKLELSKYQKKFSDVEETLPSFVRYLPQDMDGSALAEKNILELKQELKPASVDLGLYTVKQRSLELQPRNLVQIGVQMHSSAPGSMNKETFAEDTIVDETCLLLPLKSENEDSLQMPYESPHTSLTEAVNSVTVIEDNMTDAVKITVHHEIKLLQNKVELLEEENERLLSELEAMNSERVNLYKVKDKYLALVEERVKLTENLQERESQLHRGDEVTSIRSIPPVSLSSPVQDKTDLQEKEARICDLKIQMDTLSSENAQLQKQVVDLTRKLKLSVGSSKDGSLDFGLQEVKHILTHELQSTKGQLTRAESEQSDYEMNELRTNLKKIEEENSELKMHAEILSEELESLKRKCEGEGHKKSLTQAAELKASRLEIALKDSKNALQRKDKEIQNTNNYVAKLEDCLQRSRQERDRQHKQITKLLAIKADLMEELHVLGDNKQLSHDFEEALVMKNAEVSGLQQEKAALLDEIQSYKEEMEHQKLEVSYLKDDFEAERKDRENMASKMDDLTWKWTTRAQELNEKIEEMKEQCYSEKYLKENAEFKLQQASEKWNILKQKYEQDIVLLTNQVEELQTNMGEEELRMDQCQKEFDAKLQVAEAMLLKEKQEHLVLKEKYENNKKEFKTIEAHFREEKLKLLSQQQTLEMQFQETKHSLEESEQHFSKKMDQNAKQIQSLNLLRRAMSIQLEEEKQRADERLDTISKLSRDISTKDHMISQYKKELQSAQDHLQKHKFDSLKNYEIKEVHCIKSKINAGSYGSISLVNVNGMLCIQKCLHDILVGLNGTEAVSKDQQRIISEKFYEECRLLWKMRHPNIVQFMGIHYNGEVKEIHKMSLIMEYLPSNVEDCITKCSQTNYFIPWSIKISVLRDVTHGLSHLHANGIIHRDLSAANILLTYSMGAKIADLGVSKLVSSSTNTKFTAAPGANYIMPPEALEENPQYDDKLDIFSLGIFILYLTLQKEPNPQNTTLKTEHLEKKQIEIGRRLSHIDHLEKENSNLANVVKEALQDNPKSRPTAASLCTPMNTFFKEVKDKLYPHLMDFIKSIGNDILVFPDS